MHTYTTAIDGAPTPPAALLVDAARELARSRGLPSRWSHTVGVATRAEQLARVLAPASSVSDIVAAAWAHDIGYAQDLSANGFHPIDGAAFLAGTRLAAYSSLPNVIGLVAHHSGAIFEARERNLIEKMRLYPAPKSALELAILNCADLSTTPSGTLVDPAERLNEVLDRYGAEDPVHRAITKSAPLLLAQARLILGAARAAGYMPAYPADALGARPAAQRSAAVSQYRAFFLDNNGIRREPCGLTAPRGATSFQLEDVVRLHLNAARQGRSIAVDQRAFITHSHVTEWSQIASLNLTDPIDWPTHPEEVAG
ncbi:hypothetical protein BKG82_27020 [Mycobacteroides chelonae]|uniref:HD domain-containing protein n=1 Tax=Mycobacteroides chelonae TaxID=1774 RepID=A0A1S1LIR4_MYCCH|nr:HD domain-containing protein [Mycobacteroides chelonae]OHU47306.1 hypothetical protein BKG82_27020 [Mycobacteroides chelonae]